MAKTNKCRIPCKHCGLKCKGGQGLSLHMRLHCRQKPSAAAESTQAEACPADEVCSSTTNETAHNPVPSDGNPPEVQQAILLFLRWMPRKLIFTGRTRNANKCARILHVWQSFFATHASFFAQKFNYVPLGKPGQRVAQCLASSVMRFCKLG